VLGNPNNYASDDQNSQMTQTNLEIAGSARFFRSLLGVSALVDVTAKVSRNTSYHPQCIDAAVFLSPAE
jgi:hypothetical protein